MAFRTNYISKSDAGGLKEVIASIKAIFIHAL